MAVVTEFVNVFKFKGSVAPLDNFNKGMGKALSLIGAAVAGFTAIAGAIQGMAVSTLKGRDAMIQLSRVTGVSVEAIQELGFAASVSGSSAEALEGTMSSLSQRIGEAAQKGSEEFARLGISVRKSNGEVKNAAEVLDEVRKRFGELNLSLQEQRTFAETLGIDASLIQLLGKSASEVAALRQEARQLGIITGKEAKGIIKFNDNITRLSRGFAALKERIAIGLAPAIKATVDAFNKWLIVNKDFLVEVIQGIVNGVGVVFKVLSRLGGLIGSIIENTVGWKVALVGLGAALAIAFAPLVLLVTGITAIVLIIDDLIVAFNGGKSAIGDFYKEMIGFDIVPVLQALVVGFKEAFTAIGGFFKDAMVGFKIIGEYIGGIIYKITQSITAFVDKIIGVVKAVKGFGSKVAGFFGFGNSGSSASVPPSSSLNRQAANSSSSSSIDNRRVDQNVTINVSAQGGQDAALETSVALQEQLRDAQIQVSRGGR